MGKLCPECGSRAKLQEIRREYTETAKKVMARRAGCAPYSIPLLLASCSILPITSHRDAQDMWAGIQGFLFMALIVAVPCIIHTILRNNAAERSLADAAATRPGFRAFYHNYLAQEAAAEAAWDKEVFFGLLGGIVGGVVEGTVKGAEEAAKHMARDVTTPTESGVELRLRDIGNKLDKL
jgi:hypothetical protein